jgi:hypothetical protein
MTLEADANIMYLGLLCSCPSASILLFRLYEFVEDMGRDNNPPEWMDIDIKELPTADNDLVARSTNPYVYKYKEYFAVKPPCGNRKLEMMRNAGDCSISPHGSVLRGGKQVLS